MSFSLLPIEVVSAPNFYSPVASGTFDLISSIPATLNFLLMINDNLGPRPYFAAMAATLTLTFARMNQFAPGRVNPIETPQSLTKTATRNVQNPALYSLTLTTQDVQAIRSGSLTFTLVENGVATTTTTNWAVTKKLTDPGC